MASPAQHDQYYGHVLLDHAGPWTEEEFLALPDDRRIELLDGRLLVSPGPGGRHQRMSSQLWHALGRAAPDWLEVLEAINVRVGPDRVLRPQFGGVPVAAGPLRRGRVLRARAADAPDQAVRRWPRPRRARRGHPPAAVIDAANGARRTPVPSPA